MNIAFQILTPGVNFDLSEQEKASRMAGFSLAATTPKKQTPC